MSQSSARTADTIDAITVKGLGSKCSSAPELSTRLWLAEMPRLWLAEIVSTALAVPYSAGLPWLAHFGADTARLGRHLQEHIVARSDSAQLCVDPSDRTMNEPLLCSLR